MRTRTEAIRAGEPLTPVLRCFLEDAFGSDLNQVRIHHGCEADSLSRELGGLAFAQGENVFFRRGAFAPGTPWGLWLLTHELAHVLQQRGSSRLSSSVHPRRAAALEWEANVAASAVLMGQRVVVPPRDGCPSIQRWEIDMHLIAVYWTGRTQGASHQTASRTALASQSLDDSDQTEAPSLKIAGITDWTGINYRFANNAHALGVSFSECEEVAKEGIRHRNELLFGLGLHTVGDFLAHANLSGNCTVGHQEGPNEDGSWSGLPNHTADFTVRNPRKALDTIALFVGLWADFRGGPPFLSVAQQELFVEFVLAQPATKGKGDAYRKGINLLGVAEPRNSAEIDAVGGLGDISPLSRHRIWEGDNVFLSSAERKEAENLAWQFWLRRENDRMLHCAVDDVRLASGSWGNLSGGYSNRVPIPRPYTPPPMPPFGRDPKF